MSGIEVAGIALAVFPIILDGISHFVEGIETVRRWRHYRIRLLSYADVIETQKVYYLDTLEGLLIDLVDSEDDMAHLMAEPGGMFWQKTEYARKLKQRLHRSYHVFIKAMKDMLQNLSAMCRKLGIGTAGEVRLICCSRVHVAPAFESWRLYHSVKLASLTPSCQILWDEYSVMERGMNRLKVTLSRNVYQGYIDAIDKANKDLRDITRQNVYLEPLRRSRKPKRPIADINLVRRHAASLYQMLIAGTAWSCQCRENHLASLRLEPRPRPEENDGSGGDFRYSFRILLARSKQPHSVETTAEWQEIVIKPSAIRFSSPNSGTKVPRQSRKVQFVTHRGKQEVIPGRSHSQSPLVQSTTAILDMCQALCSYAGYDEPMGFLICDNDKDYQHYLYRADTLPIEEPQSTSLSELLSERTWPSKTGRLSKRERLEIAVTLASSVLQLDGSPWLKSRWSSHDIYFHQKWTQAPCPRYLHPYLAWKQCSIKSNMMSNTESLSFGSHLIRSEVLFALGLTLGELCFGKTLELMKVSDEEEDSVEIAAAKTALKLIDLVYDEMGDTYGDVVRRCLLQPFDVRNMSLNNEEVQLRVYESIVVPLAEDLENFKGKARIR